MSLYPVLCKLCTPSHTDDDDDRREEKLSRHVALVAKFLDDNKLKISLKK